MTPTTEPAAAPPLHTAGESHFPGNPSQNPLYWNTFPEKPINSLLLSFVLPYRNHRPSLLGDHTDEL